MRTIGCVLALVLALPSAASALSVMNPNWLAKPNGDDISEAYPKLAWILDIEGRVTVSCDITAQGGLIHCQVIDESPQGLGFGQAGLSLTPAFLMKPLTIDGEAAEGGKVRIPLAFRFPGKPPETEARTSSKPAAPKQLVLARKVVDKLGPIPSEVMASQLSLEQLDDDQAMAGADPAVRDDARTAVHAAFKQEQPSMAADLAVALATRLNPTQLQAALDWVANPVSRDPASGGVIQDVTEDLAWRHGQRVIAAARAAFCAKHACTPEPKAKP